MWHICCLIKVSESAFVTLHVKHPADHCYSLDAYLFLPAANEYDVRHLKCSIFAFIICVSFAIYLHISSLDVYWVMQANPTVIFPKLISSILFKKISFLY